MSRPASLTPRRSENTPSGCRERAASSLAAAAGMDTDNGRLRLQASADSWTARADLLERLELRHDAREASEAARHGSGARDRLSEAEHAEGARQI